FDLILLGVFRSVAESLAGFKAIGLVAAVQQPIGEVLFPWRFSLSLAHLTPRSRRANVDLSAVKMQRRTVIRMRFLAGLPSAFSLRSLRSPRLNRSKKLPKNPMAEPRGV